MHALVYVIAKAPRAGQAKTRLSPPLQPGQAARLAGAFLRDTVDVALRAGVAVRVICRSAAERAALQPLAGPVVVHVQHGQGLGAALESAFALGLADGYARVGVLGADLPALPPAVIAAAFAGLDHADVALGPSDDGGYYLLAARQVYRPLFHDMVWSTSQVAQETLRRCAMLQLRTHVLAMWPDVDDVAALRRLRATLQGQSADVAPHTRAVLADLPPSALRDA
jgi:rSAM/selenodomain-associated transferase 1